MKSFDEITEREASFEARLKDHIVLRVDGKNFSKWTRKMEKPFDMRFVKTMQETTRFVMDYIGAQTAYTQSDEINFFLKAKEGSKHFLGGRLQKLGSITAAITTSAFQQQAALHGLHVKDHPVFDCRLWSTEDLRDVLASFRWRENNAVTNSISMAAHHEFSKNYIFGKNLEFRKEQLRRVGKPWEELPNQVKFGTHFVKVKVKRPYTYEEIQDLPAKHDARKNPDLVVERQEIIQVNANGTNSIKNYESFILEGKL
jgi:tRNA(His) 5'-end guanylyltransferase